MCVFESVYVSVYRTSNTRENAVICMPLEYVEELSIKYLARFSSDVYASHWTRSSSSSWLLWLFVVIRMLVYLFGVFAYNTLGR